MIYLDNASTSWPKPPRVADAMADFVRTQAGSPSHAGHRMSESAERLVLDVRTMLARLINAADPNRMILCYSATDALNAGLKGTLAEGDHVICSSVDHNSVSRPLQAMCERDAITLTRLPVTRGGTVDPDAVRKAITSRTKLIALNHASNVTGVIQPAAEIGAIAREHDLLFFLDASQTAGLLDLDVEAMRADMVAFPGHKSLLGPTGTGVLYAGERTEIRPWREGGTGADSIAPTQPSGLPVFLEAGTPNTVGFAGLRAALTNLDPAANLRNERNRCAQLVEALADGDSIRLAHDWSSDSCVPVLSLVLTGFSPQDVGAILDESFGIAVRPGLHCAPYIHRTLGTFPDGTVRLSPGWSTTSDDIARCIEALLAIAKQPVR